MKRREFLFLPLLLSNHNLEERIKSKLNSSSHLSLDSLLKIKKIDSLRENDFSIVYNLFKEDSDFEIGTGSINYSKLKRKMDLGIDGFSSLVKIYLSISSLFSKESSSILDLVDTRYFLNFDEHFKWAKYKEGFSLKEEPKIDSNLYELNKNIIILNGNNFVFSNKLIHCPLSAAFEIINGNRIKNFEMVANSKHSKNVIISYIKLDDDFLVVESNFDVPIIGKFKKVYAISYNNIPIAGYIHQIGETMNYIRGELSLIKINGETII